MLRVVPNKLGGVLVMFSAIAILFLVPWLDKAKVKSVLPRLDLEGDAGRAGGVLRVAGRSAPARAPTHETYIGRVLTFLYFAFFITMPLWTRLDKTKPVPERVTTHD